jgi:hypothetical protein
VIGVGFSRIASTVAIHTNGLHPLIYSMTSLSALAAGSLLLAAASARPSPMAQATGGAVHADTLERIKDRGANWNWRRQKR